MADVRDIILDAAAALNGRDAEGYAALVLLPFVWVTDHATFVHANRPDLVAGVSAFLATLEAAGIRAIAPGIERVQAIGEGMVLVTYHTRFHFADGGLGDPFTSVATLRLAAPGWRIACVVNPAWGRALGIGSGPAEAAPEAG